MGFGLVDLYTCINGIKAVLIIIIIIPGNHNRDNGSREQFTLCLRSSRLAM
jgi:hypothetical protein